MFLGRKNQYCENDYTIKCNLQIQCDPYQITNGIFHRTETKNFTIHMETQKTLNSQSSLEKEEKERRMELEESNFLTSDYTTKLQSSREYGMVLAQKQNYRPTEKDRKPRNKPKYLWIPYFLQRRIYNGAKTTSSINGA